MSDPTVTEIARLWREKEFTGIATLDVSRRLARYVGELEETCRDFSKQRDDDGQRIDSLKAALDEEREKKERLRTLLAEAVEWARRPSPIPIRPFNDFIARAALASTGSEER